MKCTKEIEHLAKLIAFWHGQKISYHHPRDGNLTVAAVRTGDHSGFPHVTDRYMHSHWQEYTSAAEAIIRDSENPANYTKGWNEGVEKSAQVAWSTCKNDLYVREAGLEKRCAAEIRQLLITPSQTADTKPQSP